MPVETLYNANYAAPTNTGRLEFTNVGSDTFQLYSDGQTGFSPVLFKASTIEIWTASSGGTQLTLGTDYTLELLNSTQTGKAGYNVNAGIKIINATYQTGSIWIDYDIVMNENSAAVPNELQSQISTNTSNIAALSGAKVFDIYKMELSNNSTDSEHDIDISTGSCLDSTLTNSMSFASTFTKQIDASWTAGSGSGGLFSGTVAADTTYHVFAIYKDSDGTTDAGFDTSVTAANIPAGYTTYRRLGSIITDSSGNIEQFIHTWQDKTFIWSTRKLTLQTWQVPTTATLVAMDVPTGINVRPLGIFTGGASVSEIPVIYDIWNYDAVEQSITSSRILTSLFDGVASSGLNNGVDHTPYYFDGSRIKTNINGEVYFKRLGTYASSSNYSTLQTWGWVDYTL